MSSERAKSSGSPRSKPATRSSSLRQSLNLASVGKALMAGVRSKENSDENKAAKKSKDSSRRLSTVNLAPPRASLDGRPPSHSAKREGTPDSKTITRKRISGSFARSSTEESAMRLSDAVMPQGAPLTRASTVARSRTANATSALPKYRPKSALMEVARPSSPVKAGTRRRLSTSSEEDRKEQRKPEPSPSPKGKIMRPISPLPHRAALKASSVVNSTPPRTPSTPSRVKPLTPAASKASPSRPNKVMKTANASTTSIPRPSSSMSSLSSSLTPHTPKSSALKAALTRSAQDKTKTGISPIKSSPITPARNSPSPLARHSRQNSKPVDNAHQSQAGNMSHISEVNSEDSEEEDVLLLLAPIAELAAPTPAMPRIQRTRKRVAPETPMKEKPNPQSGRNTLRVAPPSSGSENGSFLRPPRQPGNERAAARASILSWEQLSHHASRTLGEDDVERMISEIPAPFSGPTSPSLSSHIDIPPSPCLSAIDSPGGYGSISQVLLPDVTPSPAVYSNTLRFSVSPEAAGESSATYLRLQLVAAENQANVRLMEIQAMEEEIYNLKQAHALQMEEMAKQMMFMDKEDERASYTAALEEQLRATRINNEQAIHDAVMQSEENARRAQEQALKVQKCNLDVTYSTIFAAAAWTSVQDTCKAELDSIRGEREVLALLLMELEQMCS